MLGGGCITEETPAGVRGSGFTLCGSGLLGPLGRVQWSGPIQHAPIIGAGLIGLGPMGRAMASKSIAPCLEDSIR